MYPVTLGCSDLECGLRIRVGRVLSKKAFTIGAFKYCPVCGKVAMGQSDTEQDYWEITAEHFQIPLEALKILYEDWPTKTYPRFGDYIRQVQKEIEDESNSRTV